MSGTNSQTLEWRDRVRQHLQAGELPQAAGILEKQLAGAHDRNIRISVLSELVKILTHQSRYRDAFRHAESMDVLLRPPQISSGLTILLSYFLIAIMICRLTALLVKCAPLCASAMGVASIPWVAADALMQTIIWLNVPRAHRYAVIAVFCADTPEERLRSLAHVSYFLVLRGHTLLGLIGLRHAIRVATSENYHALQADLRLFLGLAYHFAGKHEHATAAYDNFEKNHTVSNPYLAMLCHANRVHNALTNDGPIEVEQALRGCFKVSFTLPQGRNRIHICGAKAALLSLAGYRAEAEVFLREARDITFSNDARHDYIHYFKYEALVALHSGDNAAASRSLAQGRRFIIDHGDMPWHHQEYDRLTSVLRSRSDANNAWPAIRLILCSLRGFCLSLTKRGLSLAWSLFQNGTPSYWRSADCAEYLRRELASGANQKLRTLERTIVNLTRSLLDSHWLSFSSDPAPGDLESRLRTAFPDATVFVSDAMSSVLQLAKQTVRPLAGIVHGEVDGRLRVACERDRFIVAVESSADRPGIGAIAAALVVGELDVVSQSVVEAGLEVLVSQFVSHQRSCFDRAEMLRLQRSSAIARTTQALAHDVRKPFSLLEAVLEVIANSEDLDEVRGFAGMAVSEVRAAMTSVNGMLRDIMEFGASSTRVGSVSPKTLIRDTLQHVFTIYRDSKICFGYDLCHRSNVNVDYHRIIRVFANIVENAVEANRGGGTIWFRTAERTESRQVEFRIGNSGSYIPEDQRKQLFEAFYTSGKPTGTGLGLAIAEKIVTDHGGSIWCDSSKVAGTEFAFTLPSHTDRDAASDELAVESPEIAANVALSMATTAAAEQASLRTLERQLAERLQCRGRKLYVLVIDDDASYANATASLLRRVAGSSVTVFCGESADEVYELCTGHRPQLIILDVDLGPGKADGLTAARDLRVFCPSATICIHTNRGWTEFHEMTTRAGADVFLPKPMSRAHLVRLLLSAVNGESIGRNRAKGVS
jgi:signal transduction histidine kinase/CheY-like chemotaxis protein